MTATYDNYTGDNSNKNFSYTFPVLKKEDVKVSVDGAIQTSGYTVNETNTRVEFDTAPANGTKVKVYRQTEVGDSNGTELPARTFSAGSSIRASDLTANQEQALFGIQELQEQPIGESKLDIHADPSGTDKVLGYTSNGMEWVAQTGGGGSSINVDDTPTNGDTTDAISSNWAYDHNAATGNSAHVPAAGSSGQFLKHDGTWGAPTFIPGWTNAISTRTINVRLQDVVYAKDFGVTGDGSTDDTTNLQNAINYVVQSPGKELVLTAGVYKVTAQITATLDAKHEQLHIRGDGNVIIKFTPGSNVNCLKVNIDNNHYASDVSTGAPRVSIRNIEFAYDGGTNSYGQAIRLEGANTGGQHTQICLIDNCQFVPWDDLAKWFSVGLYIKDLHEVSVQNCSFYADNNQDNNQINTGVWIESTSSASACHYYFNNSTFLYGDCGIRVGPVGSEATSYVEGLYVNNCGFVACDHGIIMDGDESGNDAVEPGLQVTNCHFNTNTSQYGYGISTDSIVDILLIGNLFYSGRDLTSNPGSASYRGCVFINQGETFNITGNIFKSIGEGQSSANIYDYGNYHNTAIRIGAQTNSALLKDIGLIQNNLFDGFKGTEKAIWLEANTTKIQAIETLNAFNECDTNILDQGTNNIIQGKFGGASSSAAGSAGLVPKPAAGDQTKYLKGDGTWATVSGGGGIALSDLSVGTEGTASGDGSIGYNNSTGVFTYTPPNLSGYSTTSHNHDSSYAASSHSHSYAPVAGSESIITLGTISTGTWQGTAIASTYVGDLAASKITSGTFDAARIPDDTSKMPLAGGTFTGSVTFEDAINENVFAITDGNAAIDPDNGTIQTWTLGDDRTPTDSLTAGQSVLLMITAGSYQITWPTMTWAGGSAPTLSTTATTAIELWKVGSTLYGANVGDV